ncbi:hypothetical protein U1707_14770 [Sphingomonas sp. PB2P12]|uniref:hypothetical protein n=1 Tax=Sphingomonas sandaracina TaxID=3096157 RepID=UPI002FC8110E
MAERQPKARPRTALTLAPAAHPKDRTVHWDAELGAHSRGPANYAEAIALHREITVRTERPPLCLVPFVDDLWLADMRQDAIAIAEEIVVC